MELDPCFPPQAQMVKHALLEGRSGQEQRPGLAWLLQPLAGHWRQRDGPQQPPLIVQNRNISRIFSAHLHLSNITLETPEICVGSFPEQGRFHKSGLVQGEFLGISASEWAWPPCSGSPRLDPQGSSPSPAPLPHAQVALETHSPATRCLCSSGSLASPSQLWESRGPQQLAILAV